MADNNRDKILKALPKLPRPKVVKKDNAVTRGEEGRKAAIKRGEEGRKAAIKRGEEGRKAAIGKGEAGRRKHTKKKK